MRTRHRHLTADWFGEGHDLDPDRLNVAFHEIGHLTVWETLPGARVLAVKVTGKGNGTEGLVHMRWPKNAPEIDRGYLVGRLAGSEADRLRCDQTGDRPDTAGWGHDMADFRRVRRQHEPSRQWTEAELRAEARRLLLAQLPRAQRRALQLARYGHLHT
ncbi:hypothetical protein [Actinokineospora iranica]|uniref:Peptidase family M41 n=1 Tax=Actinokineospora iranica TaxID=1271860 RepID=A0A1G6YXA3_9PSEU|nr:hypothetical protein [Actinokineospora iranica]SDD94892.1 hypothetical protein SAMN05216174_12419 [Actinokineospora iranica]